MLPLVQYPHYIERHLPWLNKTPTSWEIKRGKNIFKCIDIRSTDGSEELLTVSSNNGVVPRRSAIVTMFKADSYVGYKLCWPNDLVINSLWSWAGGLGVSKHHGIISSAYGVYRLKPEANCNPFYIHELVRSSLFQWELMVRSKGIWTSRLQLTDDSFLNIPFPIPPANEQDAIVRYLNHATIKIQRQIKAKLKLIKLLEEQKQAVLHQAIFGIIDVSTGKPYSHYKSSKINWFDSIPHHWQIRKLKTTAVMIVSNVDKHTNEDEISARICNYVDVYKNDRITEGLDFMKATVSTSELNNFKIKIGDVIVTKDSEIWTDIGVPALVEYESDDLVCGYHLAIIRPLEKYLEGEFVFRLLQDVSISTQLHISANGVTRYGLSHKDIKNMLLLVPPIEEQKRIIRYINSELYKIDKTIEKTRKEIELLKEYRISLIAEVVTGKVDVREAAKHIPNENIIVEEDIQVEDTDIKVEEELLAETSSNEEN